MSYFDTPEDPYVLDIISVSYGNRDFTAYVRTQFEEALNQNPSLRTWGFVGGLDFFKINPNSSILKACVVVYRNTFANLDGSVTWSNFKSVGVIEGGRVDLVFDGVKDLLWVPPDRPMNSQFIVAAYWYSQNVTEAAAKQFLASLWSPGKDIALNVSPGSLGPDPAIGTVKQFCVTYGDWVYPGFWQFSLRLDWQAENSWDLTIPVHFPPRDLSLLQGANNFLRARNEDPVVDVFPLLYDATTSELIWDGRIHNQLVVHGTTRYLNLFELGCQERHPYFFGYVSSDGTKLVGDSTYTMIAVSSSSGSSATMYWRISGGVIMVGHDLTDTSPPVYSPRDLRLNIYMASWGSQDYTDFIRQQYITSTMAVPPADVSNTWSTAASLATFGADPNYGVGKSCVIIYKLGYCVGYTDGQVNNPNDPSPEDPRYSADKIRSVFTNRYPVINDISGFLFRAAREGEAPISFDLLQLLAKNTPMVWPDFGRSTIYYPLVAKAVYANLEVTAYVQNLVNNAWARGPPPATNVPVNVTSMTGNTDPWPQTNKQMTILIGYNMGGVRGSYQWVRLVVMKTLAPWTMTLDGAPPVRQPSQWPKTFSSYKQPIYNQIVFKNETSLNCWPQVVVDGGQIVWDGRKQTNAAQWQIATGQSKSFQLMSDLKLIDGKSYCVTFVCDVDTFIPFSGWIIASGTKPQFSMTMTYLPDVNLSEKGRFEVLKESMYLGL